MAKTRYEQQQYPARDFVESAGAILFDFRHTGITQEQLLHPQENTTPKPNHPKAEPNIALFYSAPRDEVLLPKGRRNINESRADAAIRETYEETGLRCQLLPITLDTRATSVDPSHDRVNPEGFTLNEPRRFTGTVDSFWVTVRHGRDRQQADHVKLIWWFIAVVMDEQDEVPIQLDPGCELRSVPAGRAAETCTFEEDRHIVREACRVVKETLGISWGDDGVKGS